MADVSKIQIWNQALGYIGTRRVASDAENCEEARQCALYWDSARQQALRDFPFPWAQHRAMLAQKNCPTCGRQIGALPTACRNPASRFTASAAPAGVTCARPSKWFMTRLEPC